APGGRTEGAPRPGLGLREDDLIANFSGKVNGLKRCRGKWPGAPHGCGVAGAAVTWRWHGVLSCAAVIVPSPALSPAEQRAVVSRVTRRLVAFAFISYVLAYADPVNIGFAATPLQRDLRLSDTAYGIGAGLFFLGYCLFQIPSHLLL